MGSIKRLVEDYCEVIHPDDVDAQDELFCKIVRHEVEISMEEMHRAVNNFRMKDQNPDGG